VSFESLGDVLKHPIRRKIILALYEKKCLSYVDLMNFVEVTNTGKFNYHLKVLGDLIEKDKDGKYCLTEKGQMAAQLLQKFPEKKPQPTLLCMADAVIIGFVGVALTVVNPVFWISSLISLLKLEVPVPFFFIIWFSVFAYALIVPGAVIWLLTVRRTHLHDMYDLLKPPFTAFILLLVLLIAMAILKINLIVTITSPVTYYSATHSSYAMMTMHLQLFLLWSLAFSFLGVLIAEFVSKIRKRIAF
jgi:glucan phosphoethanolaminetransferase (alkaline phosphatase superfamily)